MIKFEESLAFDDVLLKPKFSRIKTRADVDLSVDFGEFKFNLPIVPANMSSVFSEQMADKMYSLKSLTIMDRFSSIENQVGLLKRLENKHGKDIYNYVGVSVGVKDHDKDNVKLFSDLGVKIICIDIAHFDSVLGLSMCEFISKKFPHIFLIAGNIATKGAAIRAWKAGAHVVKCGIGGGATCLTRDSSAAGNLMLSCVIEVADAKKEFIAKYGKNVYFIADGGHTKPADCVKSLCFADMVMLGSMLAGTDLANGELIEIKGEFYKEYSGSSTHKVDKFGKPTRHEGVKASVRYKGSFEDVVQKICEGIQSGCSYQNATNLKELREDPTFIRITNAGIKESGIHSVSFYR